MKYDKNINGVKNRKQASRRVEPEHLQVPNFVQTPPSQRPATPQRQQQRQQGQRQANVRANTSRHRKRRKKNYILYYIIFWFLLTVTGITLSLTVFFKIESFTVTGIEGISADKIIADSLIKKGENMFMINAGKSEKSIVDKNLTIDSVNIKRKLPAGLEIEITMAKTKAELFYAQKYYSLSHSDKIIGLGEAPLDKEAIRIAGCNLKEVVPGQYIKADDKNKEDNEEQNLKNKIEVIDITLEAIEKTKCSEIKLIDVTDEMDIRLFYGDSFEIKAGGVMDIEYKLQWAKNIIDQKLDAQSEMGIIDVSVNNGYYYFKHSDKVEKPTGM